MKGFCYCFSNSEEFIKAYRAHPLMQKGSRVWFAEKTAPYLSRALANQCSHIGIVVSFALDDFQNILDNTPQSTQFMYSLTHVEDKNAMLQVLKDIGTPCEKKQ